MRNKMNDVISEVQGELKKCQARVCRKYNRIEIGMSEIFIKELRRLLGTYIFRKGTGKIRKLLLLNSVKSFSMKARHLLNLQIK